MKKLNEEGIYEILSDKEMKNVVGKSGGTGSGGTGSCPDGYKATCTVSDGKVTWTVGCNVCPGMVSLEDCQTTCDKSIQSSWTCECE